VQVGIHPGFKHGDAAQFVEFRRMGIVVKGAGDEHVKVGIACFAGGGNQIGA